MKKGQLTCFVGVIGSGKDYQAKKLKEFYYEQINFADLLRQLAWSILDWKPEDDLEYEAFKKGHAITGLGIGINGRKLLQNIGTTMRLIDPDFFIKEWSKEVEKRLNQGFNICCSDLRFPNELQAARLLGAKIIFCNYHSNKYENDNRHESEKLAQQFIALGYKDLDVITDD